MINFPSSIPNIPKQQNVVKQQYQNNKPVSAQSFKGTQTNDKISFSEGANIFLSGIEKQCGELVLSIIKNPVKTIGIVAGSTLALSALPLIGIPAAVGGGALALGFAGFAIGKTIAHATQFVKNNNNGDYFTARQNLQQMGEDSVDLALSVPFAPKGVTQVKNFAQYGKIAINKPLLNELKSTKSIKQVWTSLRNSNKNISRDINYQCSVDKELAKLERLTDAQKATLKKELLEFNVPQEKIPEVVLDKWAEIRGIKTKPDLKFETLAQGTAGQATPRECKITMNDHKHNNIPETFSDYQLVKRELVSGQYQDTYKKISTGEIVKDSIDKNIADRYSELYKQQEKLAPQSKKILATVHEREHIHQYARIFENNPDWLPVTDRAKQLYAQMVQEMPAQTTAQRAEVQALENARNNGTPISYVKNAREVGAREMEWKAMGNETFQTLDGVFKRTNKLTPPKINNIVLENVMQIESAKS